MRDDNFDPYSKLAQEQANKLIEWKRLHAYPSRWRGIWNFIKRLFK